MKISNFRNVVKIPSGEYGGLYSIKADVDVTTTSGALWWKKHTTETHQVFKGATDVGWIWTDTGKWTPEFRVEHLYRAYCAQEAINKSDY